LDIWGTDSLWGAILMPRTPTGAVHRSGSVKHKDYKQDSACLLIAGQNRI